MWPKLFVGILFCISAVLFLVGVSFFIFTNNDKTYKNLMHSGLVLLIISVAMVIIFWQFGYL